MNQSGITISWEENSDGGYDIHVDGERKYALYFVESFLTVEKPSIVHFITEREISGKSAGKSATIALLSNFIRIIRTSYKTKGRLITERERDLKFPMQHIHISVSQHFAE